MTSAGYLPFGPLTSLTYGNGTTKTFTYDARYRPLENQLTGPGGAIADYTYATDAVGNITQIHDATSSAYNRDFGYDDLNRLITANGGTSLWGSGSFSYDAMGNVLSFALGTAHTGTFSYVGTTPKIATATENGVSRAVAYDAAGNEAAVGGGTSSYSTRNFLSGAGSATYGYDGRGVRSETGIRKLDLTLSALSAVGSSSVTGTVTLHDPAPAGGATVTLSSNDTATATVPGSITIAADGTSGTFTVTTFAVPAAVNVTISATYSSATATAGLTVTPGPWTVASLAMSPVDILTPGTSTGTVTLNSAAPAGGVRVQIDVTPDTDPPPAPFSVVVPAASTSTTFTVTGHAPPAGQSCFGGDCPQTYTVTATFVTSQSACFTVHTTEDYIPGLCGGLGLRSGEGPSSLLAISSWPEHPRGGDPVTLTIQLTAPAPEDGMEIELSSSDAAVVVPQRLVIPAGQRSVIVEATTSAMVDEEKTVRITAVARGVKRETTVLVEPQRSGPRQHALLFPPSLSLSARLIGPDSVTGDYKRRSLYTPELQLLTETDTAATPALAYEYIWFGGMPVAQYDIATSTTHWTFTDHLGTPILQTDASGAVDWRAEYEPYGRVFAYRAGATRHQPLRFPGQEYDGDAPEREYNIFRWYREGWGRYSQADPIGLYNSLNLWAYAHANPLRLKDRMGLFADPGGAFTTCLRLLQTAGAEAATPSLPRMPWLLFLFAKGTGGDTDTIPDPSQVHRCKTCGEAVSNESGEDRHDRCDVQLTSEEFQCKAWWPTGSDERRACIASARVRYAECLRFGHPHSPLRPTPLDDDPQHNIHTVN